jgi:hypothetical protein
MFAPAPQGIARKAAYARDARVTTGIPAGSPHMELGSEEEITRMEEMLAKEHQPPPPMQAKRNPGPSPLGLVRARPFASPSELLASPSELSASPSELLAPPSEL